MSHRKPIFAVSTIIALQFISPFVPAAAPASQPTSAPSTTVSIDNFHFDPKDLQVSIGTTVTWQNKDDVPHTATSSDDPQTFDSGALDTEDRYSFTFKKAGRFSYYCKVHPHMTGTITVK